MPICTTSVTKQRKRNTAKDTVHSSSDEREKTNGNTNEKHHEKEKQNKDEKRTSLHQVHEVFTLRVDIGISKIESDLISKRSTLFHIDRNGNKGHILGVGMAFKHAPKAIEHEMRC